MVSKVLTGDRTLVLGLALTLVSVVAACQRAASPATAEDAAVRAASLAWDVAHNAGNVTALTQLYAESAVSMPYNRPAIDGRAAIEADFRKFFEEFTARHTTTIVSLEISGDWAIERGNYELSAVPKLGGPPMAEQGKHIVIRKREAGVWKIQSEIWNTNAPPPAPPSSPGGPAAPATQ